MMDYSDLNQPKGDSPKECDTMIKFNKTILGAAIGSVGGQVIGKTFGAVTMSIIGGARGAGKAAYDCQNAKRDTNTKGPTPPM